MHRDPHTERRKIHPSQADMPARPSGVVVALPTHAARPARRAPATGESRGEIVLFLGVRYERLAS
ncbi:hypothetical protein [Methylobacterium aerolatum]|uniref:Uncharacterized protein n=1 Tax=Methylobacterium aerolatum TaxID=418708 RepID=A0ABU0HYX5_9HYPH|nr:hypothetical protein [Methylobacterium aerolatum]MDQ0446684.1 hypothetical protein [Methylobacterium aerolatum]GJD33651.1 hypothetical protein FMGBMHLM_0543 [Methylobacterium aerolatum]